MYEVTLQLPRPEPLASGELDNADRAAMVAPLLRAYGAAYYQGSESAQTVLSDFMGDLGHLFDRLAESFPDDVGPVSFDPEDERDFVDLVDVARRRYWEEVELQEMAEAEEAKVDADSATYHANPPQHFELAEAERA